MSDQLVQGAAWLADQRHRHLTHPVTYRRGGTAVTLGATIGRTLFEQADDYGQVQRFEARDFLLRSVDLVLDGQPTPPRPGDRIEDAGHVYEVMAPTGQPPWRYSDPGRRTLRVHTKQVEAP